MGTPPIVSLRGAEVGIRIVAEVGVQAVRAKSVALTSLLIQLADEMLEGVAMVSPRDSDRRGGHVGLAHPSAWQIAQALIDRGVVPDFRAPDVIRLAPSPLYTRFADVWDAVSVLADIVADEAWRDHPEPRDVVT